MTIGAVGRGAPGDKGHDGDQDRKPGEGLDTHMLTLKTTGGLRRRIERAVLFRTEANAGNGFPQMPEHVEDVHVPTAERHLRMTW